MADENRTRRGMFGGEGPFTDALKRALLGGGNIAHDEKGIALVEIDELGRPFLVLEMLTRGYGFQPLAEIDLGKLLKENADQYGFIGFVQLPVTLRLSMKGQPVAKNPF